MMRVHALEVIGGQPDQYAQAQIYGEKGILQQHARHFIDQVESVLSLQQFKAFAELTNECKKWIHVQLNETMKALNYLLSEA